MYMQTNAHLFRFGRKDWAVKLLAICLVFLISSSTIFLVFNIQSANATAPTFSITGWKDGQTKVVVEFDNSVDNGAGATLDASDFAVAGANAISITSVDHFPFSNTATLTLSGSLNSAGGTDFTIACASTAVYNTADEACGATTVNVYTSVAEDTTGPVVTQVSQMGTEGLYVDFDEVVAPATMIADNFTLTTSSGVDDSTITSVFAFDYGLDITASGAVIAAGTGNTIQVGTGVTDILGNASSGETITILPSLKISEVNIAGALNSKNEFIEIYNYGEAAVDLTNLKLHLYTESGAVDTNMTLTKFETSIPANGFYLITSNYFSTGTSVEADATYLTSQTQMVADGGVYISYSATADTDVIDQVGWGTSSKKEGTASSNPAAGSSLERISDFGSTAASMAASGADEYRGNAFDQSDNNTDFAVQTTAVPQYSSSATEFAYGTSFNDEGGDTVAPTVTDAYPGASSAAYIPAELSTAGASFSETIDTTTLTTTTVQVYVDTVPGTNLCETVSYDSSSGYVSCTLTVASLPLAVVAHTFKITTGVADIAGNNLASDYTVAFTPQSGGTFDSTAAPYLMGSFPMDGSVSFPPSSDFMSLDFSGSLSAATVTTSNVTLTNLDTSGAVTITGITTQTLDEADDSILLDVSSSSLTGGVNYRLAVSGSVTSATGTAIAPFNIDFTTSSANDLTGPLVSGSDPSSAETGVAVGNSSIVIAFDEALSTATVDTDSVKLYQGSDEMAVSVNYASSYNEIEIVSSSVLDASTIYTVRLDASGSANEITNTSGIALQDTDGTVDTYYLITFTTGSSDSGAPDALYATATQSNVTVTFTESMRESKITDLTNWSLESPIGTAVPLSALAGGSVTWDANSYTAEITGISLTAAATFEVTATTGLQDMSGNAIAVAAVLGGTVYDSAVYGDSMGPDAGFSGEIYDMPTGYSTDDFGYVPQASVFPMNAMAGATSNFIVDFPISEQIRSSANGGKVVLTFPSGFDVTSAAAVTNNYANDDVNGYAPGTVAINSVAVNVSARTVTIDFSIATTCGSGNVDPCISGDEYDYISFDLEGITNTDQPRDWETSGYTVDVKTMTSTTVNETMTSMPFYITAAGDDSLIVDLTAAAQDSGTTDVHIWSPSTGEMVQAVNFATEADGTAQTTFTGLPTDYFSIWTEESILSLGGSTDNFLGVSGDQVSVSGATTKNITLTATSGLTTVTVNISGATGKSIDIYASGPNGFQEQEVASTDGSDTATFKLSDGDWFFGVGPHMPDDGGYMMPEPPDYVVAPGDIQLNVNGATVTETSGTANDGTIAFALTASDFAVTVNVVDDSANAMMDAMVYMDSTQEGWGTFGQTSGAGSATLNVNEGTYRVGAFLGGAPPTREVQVRIDSAGLIYQEGTLVAVITLELSKGAQAISGSVTDGTNAVSGASVHAFCTTNCVGYFDAGAITSSSGTYSLYVGNGTWKVEAYIPGYGPTAQTTVVVSDADETGINLAPDSTATFRTISGTVCKVAGGGADCTGATGMDGIEVYAWSNAGGSNFTQTGDDGTYSLRVPAAAGYTVEAWDPHKGPLPVLASVDTTSANQTSQDIVIDTPEAITINLKDAAGDAVTMGEVFIEFFDDTTNIRQHIFIEDTATASIELPEGTYDVLVHTPGVEVDENSDVTTDNGATTGVTAGVITVDGAEVIKIEMPALNTVSGTLTDGTDPIANAYVEVADSATGTHIGAMTDSAGDYSISVPDGTYQVNAFNPGLVLSPETVTVSGASVPNTDLAGAISDQTISGTITDLNGSAVPYAFVQATKEGGGFTAIQADADGEYALAVDDGTWEIAAIGHGYASVAATTEIDIDGSSSATNDIQFTTLAAALNEPTVKSITPKDGGTVQDSTLGLSVSIPGNATSTSESAGTVTVKETNNVVNTASIDVVGNGFEVSMVDAGGTVLSSGFDEEVTIARTMTVADLATEEIDTYAEAEDLTISYFSGNGTWIPESTTTTYLDASGDTVVTPATDLANVTSVQFTMAVDHFTVFSITVPSDGLAAAAPTSVSGYDNGSGSIVVGWNAVTTNSDASAISDLLGYEVYRDTSSTGSFTTQINSSDVLTTSYTDSTVVTGTTYYYKVTAADTGGLESAKSTVSNGVSAAAVSSGGGGGGAPTPASTTITMDSPATDGELAGGADVTLTWDASGSSVEVDLYVSYDGGTTFEAITTDQNVDVDYTWSVPNVDSDTVVLRVDVNNGGSVLDSDETTTFTIVSDSTQDVENIEDSTGAIDPVVEYYPSAEDAEAMLPSSTDIGDLVKSQSLSTVYVVGADGLRHPFSNELTYFSWFTTFEDVITIEDTEMSSISLGGPVRVRPGTWMIMIQSDPKVYAVEPGGILRWVETEEVASTLWGDTWNQKIIDVEPTYFNKYTVGDPLPDSTLHPLGSVVRSSDDSAYYLAEDGTLRLFANETAVRDNKIQTRFELHATTWDLARTVGAAISALEDVLFIYQDIGR